ncbi:MAG: choice-of-anchor J domain-containing protein [Bacteroidetes bacterium]|nr:choice-of-anchor J domain-containing protein [Bacteroidota bacterium]
MKKQLYLLLAFCALLGMQNSATAQAYSENFDDITTLAGSGWLLQNNSSPVGSLSWFQGTATTATPTPGPFNSFNGADNSYIAANFNSTGSTGTISNWLITPNRTLRNGDVFTFYTRKPTIGAGQTDYPDRLEVRLSTNGASTNVGTGANTTGDFTTLLLSINPTLVTNVYPQTWTQYTVTISGLPAPTSGRIAFRYFVTGAGSLGTNSDYIGIDAVNYTPYVCPVLTVNPTTLPGGTAGSAYSQALSQTGALGTPSYAVTAGAVPPGVTLSAAGTISGTPTATGTFNFTVTVSDNSGCTGSRAYSITVVCPSNPISFPVPAALCSNDNVVALSGASPAGGTYSGTGVTAGQFDPAAGTQTITYDYTDPYGCAHSANQTQTVNTVPTVTLAAPADVCSDAGLVTLSGGAPAGGVYSGTGVSGGQFDPTAGSQTITYTYTDGNNCSNSASQALNVNTAPVAGFATLNPFCDNDGNMQLQGGSPAGGTYSGIGVTGDVFDVSVGTQTVTYTYTAGNGCSSSASQTLTVNAAPTVTFAAPAAVCDNAGTVTLSGESPAGGTFSGTGVTGTSFDPASGTQAITYSYTDGNGCSNSASQTLTVNTAPTVTLAAPTAVCDNGGTVTLSGESPAGGTFSGTGVTGTSFDPASGTQAITYSYTDGNGCSNSATATLTVNAAPTVTLATLADVCDNAGAITLSGGAPAGGTYSGIGVTAGSFDPTAGTQTVTYTYTDGNGCSNDASQTQTVNTCTGIETIDASLVSCYPNPTTGTLTVNVSNVAGAKVSVRIVDLVGKLVAEDTNEGTYGTYNKVFSLGALAQGTYLVEVRNGAAVYQQKVVKQ